jgi:inhibitor of KinA sporulation pathway (predicted exonuclease)
MATQQQQTFNAMEAIIDVMSGKSDLLMTIHNVHARLYEKYKSEMNDPSKRDDIIRQLKKAFRHIESEYDNIYRIFRGNGEYLIWSLKSRDEILQSLESLQTYEDYLRNGKKPNMVEYCIMFPNIEADLQLPKEKTVLEKIIEMLNARDLTFVSDMATVDGNLNAIQFLIKDNHLDLLRRIYDLSSIPLSTKTIKSNQTCSDLAMATGNCAMVEFVIRNSYEQQNRSLRNQIDTLKATQATLYDDIRRLRTDNKLLQTQCESSRLSRLMNQIKTYFFYFMIIYFMFFR